MEDLTQTLSILPDTFAICRMDIDAEFLSWAYSGSFFSITRTSEELSIICTQTSVPENIVCDKGWKCMKIEGASALSSIGVLASVTTPLALAGISIFAASTYNTDYVLVSEKDLKQAVMVLSEKGHRFNIRCMDYPHCGYSH